MSTKLPTISVTTDKYSYSESSNDDSEESNDMDYDRNSGGVTDVEDFDSQADAAKPHSRRSSINALKPPRKSQKENDVTDVEDYNDSDSEDEEKSNIYPELKMSLQEFLQHGHQEEAVVNNEMNEKIEIKAGNFMQAQTLNGIPDYLTDCEDYNTDSELEYDCEKSVCVDLDAAVEDQGRVCITDVTRPLKTDDDSDEYEDVSVLSDISDLTSALSDIAGAVARGMSEDELLEISGDEEICHIACSGSSSGSEDDIYDGMRNASMPAIDVAFIRANGQQRRNSTAAMSSKQCFLAASAANEEVLTDVERLEDSAAEDDSFDNEEDNNEPIPRAVILAPADAGECQTDVEDVLCDDSSCSHALEVPPVQTVAVKCLPPPHREVIVLKEDKHGDTITNVMPMDKEFQFGIYNHLKDDGCTDSEDYSCADDYERRHSIAEVPLTENNFIESEVIVSNEVYKPLLSKRVELHSNAESVTDVEEIYVAGTNRRKKLKTRSISKGKLKLLDIVKNKEEGGTDIEDIDLSECDLPPNIKRSPIERPEKNTTAEKVTDVEDISIDEVSDVSEADNLRKFLVNSAIVVSLDISANKMCSKHVTAKLQLNHLVDEGTNQDHTDVEDVQLPSDAEEACDTVPECKCSDLNDMLNESYTIVHEKHGSSFNVDAEKLHIKGMPDSRDAHTDIEYVESDEPAAREGREKDVVEDTKGGVDDKSDEDDDDDDDDSERKDDNNLEDVKANIRKEATILVDKVLEESINIISGQQQEPQNGIHDSIKQEYNSDSENYAITCDDVGGLDVIKSPTIESMSGKSFDDNMSFTDEHLHIPLHSQITTTTTTTTTTLQQSVTHVAEPSVITTSSTSITASSGSNIPRVLQSKETGGEFDTTPVPPLTSTATTSSDIPTPKPRSVLAISPTNEIDAARQFLVQDEAITEDFIESHTEVVHEISTPVPKPRSQMKQSDSFKNLAALAAEQSDTISLRSLDLTEELSKTEEPSTECSVKSHHRDYTTTTTTASEDPTESFEPTSEISVDDADTEISESKNGKTTSFYIGESSRNVIIKTTPTKSGSEIALDDPLGDTTATATTTIDAKDISLMKEVSVDSDESADAFKEYVTMKPDGSDTDSKIVRQGSETRNDLLEQEAILQGETKEAKDTIELIPQTITEHSSTANTITSTSSTTSSAQLEVVHSMGEDFSDSIKEISEILDVEDSKVFATVVTEKLVTATAESIETVTAEKLNLQFEKSDWEILEKEVPQTKSKVVHSPQQQMHVLPKEAIDEAMVVKTLEEVQESLDAAKNELKFVVKDGKTIKESPSEFEFRSIAQTYAGVEGKEPITKTDTKKFKDAVVTEEDISSFIGIPENVDTSSLIAQTGDQFEGAVKECLNKEAVMLHYAADVIKDLSRESRDDQGSLGFISTGTAEDFSSIDEHAAKEEHASLGFVSTETAEDFSSMEDYFQEKMIKANVITEDVQASIQATSTSDAFGELSSEQTMKPFDVVIHRVKAESSADSTNRWSVPEIDSSSSESYYKSLSFEKTESRPLSSDVENLLTQGNSSEYQTARDASSVYRETTEYESAVSTLDSSSGKTISSHESMKSLDSQSDTSAILGSIDVSELSETLVASSTEADALEAEEMARLRDLQADDEDSEDSLEAQAPKYHMTEQQIQQSMMKRSQEMIFKPKVEDSTVEDKKIETVQIEEFPKPKEVEKTWGLAYPIDEGRVEDAERSEDILIYHGDVRRSIDESKLASSLDEGSILSVSMSSTSNVDTVVENFEDMIGSAGSSSLTGIEGFALPQDEQVPSPPEETFVMEIESKEQSPQDSSATTPPDEQRKRGHKRNESTSVAGDVLKNLTDKEMSMLGEKESESESDTDPYESEYSRQFRSPNERKSKRKKAAAAEMDHSLETEKRPFTPSQLVAEIIVEDSATEELEAEAAMIEERRPSQNMQDYSNIPDIMVTEDIQKSPILEDDEEFLEKSLYKVKTQEELHKASDEPLHQQTRAEANEENFQKLVQEQYKQKLAELQRAQVGDPDYDDHKAPDSPDSFEMVDQPDISDEFVIIEEVAKEANEVDLGGKSIKIQPTKYESKHDEEVEKIIIKSAPADPKLGSQIYRDDLNFEFEESPPTANSGDQQEDSDSGDMASANKRWVEMQLTDSQMRYPYDIASGVLEDIKEEDGEFEVGSSRISSFKDSFSSTPEYDVLAARRYFSRGEHDDVSMSSLQEFESLEQAISLENRNKTHQGSTDSSNGSFTRRYVVRHSGSGTAQDDISVSSLKEFEGLENACIEAHLIEIKAKEEAALLSRSDESNKSNGSDRENGASNVVVTKVTRTVTRTEVLPGQSQHNIEALLKQKLDECEGKGGEVSKHKEIPTDTSETKSKIDSQDSEKGSVDSLEINKSIDVMTSSIDSFDISKDATTRSDIDSLEVDRKQPTREESIDSIENEQMDFMSKFVSGGVTLGDGLTTTTTTTTTSTDADGHEHTVTQIVTTTTSAVGETPLELQAAQMLKDSSVDSLNMCVEQTTSSAGTTATYQTSAGNSQMSGSVTSCASSTLMEDSFPTAVTMSGSTLSSSYWSHEDTVVEAVGASSGYRNELEELLLKDEDAANKKHAEQQQQQHRQ